MYRGDFVTVLGSRALAFAVDAFRNRVVVPGGRVLE